MTHLKLTPETLALMFAAEMGSVYLQTTGADYPFETRNTPEAMIEEPQWFEVIFSGPFTGKAAIGMSKETAIQLAGRLLGDTPDLTGALLPEHTDAVLEVLRQACGSVATELRNTFPDIQIEVNPATPPNIPAAATSTIISKDESAPAILILSFDRELVDTMVAQGVEEETEAPITETTEVEAVTESKTSATASPTSKLAAPAAAQSAPKSEPNLNLILDVDLNVTLRFGQRKLPLSEIVDFTSGSVVELDREVDEPVELLLGNRVIARGEVVIVDGNYGLRITEVSAPPTASELLAG